nr:cytochrome ubiquinol oxidase subunit I [Akkermansia muciniphila]
MDDPVLLSRLQFAITIMFHYIFPPMTIGLGVVLVALEGLWLKTKNDLYHKQAKFWTRIFGIIFALGVASGIVMEFQFGTNWADYSRCVGDIFGSPLAAEGIFAFFLESGFLAILLFGWDKVGPKMHFLSSCMVALGAHFSAIWIIVANSWMQTPAGYKLVEVNGKIQAHITSFYDVVFNPSTVDRLTHALAGCWLAGATLVLSVSAWYILKKRFTGGSEKSFKVALVIGLIGVAGMGITGDSSAREVSVHQPAKFAAMEGVMESGAPQDLHLIGWMNPSTHEVTGISIPYLLTLLTHHDLDTSITGMNDIPQDERPPILPVFYSFHLMILIGCALAALFSGGPAGVEERLALPEALAALVLCFLRTGPANSQPGGLGRSGTGAPAMDCVRHPENGTRRIPHPHRGGSPFLPGYVLRHLCPAAGPLPLSNHP